MQTVEELQRLSGGSVIKIEWVLLYYQEALLVRFCSIACRVQPCSMCPDATNHQYRTAKTNGNFNGHYDFACPINPWVGACITLVKALFHGLHDAVVLMLLSSTNSIYDQGGEKNLNNVSAG